MNMKKQEDPLPPLNGFNIPGVSFLFAYPDISNQDMQSHEAGNELDKITQVFPIQQRVCSYKRGGTGSI